MFFVDTLSYLLGKYLRVELLGHIVSISLTLQETAKLLYKGVVPFYTPKSNERELLWPTLGT